MVRVRYVGIIAAASIVSLAGLQPASAQPGAQFEQWKEPAPTRAPQAACPDLRASTGFAFSIAEAVVLPAHEGVPESCRVQGQILPEVRFELTLPARWNGRLYMYGNGGFAGEPFTSPARVRQRDNALARGFAVVSTDTGHDAAREPLAAFATDPQKLLDYAFRAVHVTVLTAKELLRTYYGAPADRAYFDGCSTGGRQGLISAQRFPDDFDGIVVGAPVLDFSGTMVHYVRFNQALAAAPDLARKVGLLARAVYDKCDAADGLKDGLIGDPRECRFDPAADLPACSATDGGAACFTAQDIGALNALHSDVMLNGASRFPGFPLGAEVAAPGPGDTLRSGWEGWIVSQNGQATLWRRFSESFFRFMVTPGREIDWSTFSLEKSADQLQTIGALLNATDADLTRFRARGGKILMYFGWADPALNPMMGVRYYESVQKRMGPGTADFFRLFMMPGVFHCGGGPGPDRLDTMSPLVRWVETGAAPAQLVAGKRDGDKVVRTRPVCPYPQVARYKGTGSIDEAGSFSCADPGSR